MSDDAADIVQRLVELSNVDAANLGAFMGQVQRALAYGTQAAPSSGGQPPDVVQPFWVMRWCSSAEPSDAEVYVCACQAIADGLTHMCHEAPRHGGEHACPCGYRWTEVDAAQADGELCGKAAGDSGPCVIRGPHNLQMDPAFGEVEIHRNAEGFTWLTRYEPETS